MAEHKSNVLFDSNSNELEIIEFSIKDTFYGINVAKVREIIMASVDFVPVPSSHPSIMGVINLRGVIIPVVDLAKHLNMAVDFEVTKSRIIITEFNRICLGFLVGAVSRIHRITWKSVEAPSQMVQTGEGYATGILRVDDKIIFLLDFEKVATHINPRANIMPPREGQYGKSLVDRAWKKILVVEDSDLTLRKIIEHLQIAGYQTDTASNGDEAWNKLAVLKDLPDFKDIAQFYNLMVTDIEMPQMDGLHLIKKIKEDPRLKRLPCVAFSSIISKDVIKQCRKFGADGEISKPEISQLVALVDSRVL